MNGDNGAGEAHEIGRIRACDVMETHLFFLSTVHELID